MKSVHPSRIAFPANTRRWPNVGLTLDYRLRRWFNISPPLGQIVFTFKYTAYVYQGVVENAYVALWAKTRLDRYWFDSGQTLQTVANIEPALGQRLVLEIVCVHYQRQSNCSHSTFINTAHDGSVFQRENFESGSIVVGLI